METKQESRPRNTLLIVLACGGLLVGILGLAGGGVALYFVVKQNHELEIKQRVEAEQAKAAAAAKELKEDMEDKARLARDRAEWAESDRKASIAAKLVFERAEAELKKQQLDPNMVAIHKFVRATNDETTFASLKAKIDAIDKTGVLADIHYTLNKTSRFCELMMYFGAEDRKNMTLGDAANLVLNDVSKVLRDKEHAVANLAEFLEIRSSIDEDIKGITNKYNDAYIKSDVWKYIKD